jgi:hypothetical protein
LRPSLTIALLAGGLAVSSALPARDSLGIFGNWGAFRDPETPRCYAIARPEEDSPGEWDSYASIGNWPDRSIRSQVHFRLRHAMPAAGRPTLFIGRSRFELVGSGPDAWAEDSQADREIVAAMRNGTEMRIRARSSRYGRFSDVYSLRGAASAIDAAVLGCANN